MSATHSKSKVSRKSSPAAPRPGRRPLPWIALALALAVFGVYVPSLGNGFLNWDDNAYVTDNPAVDGFNRDHAAWAFDFQNGNWHPLTWFSHMLDRQVFGLRPWGHHLTNILLHAANSVLLLVVLWRFTSRVWLSAAVAAVFAFHPLHVESVAWVAERKDLLCAMFFLLALWAYAAYVQAPGAGPFWTSRRYWLVLAAFAAALLCKPMAVTLPLVLLVLDGWPLRRLGWRTVWEKIPLLALSAASCAVTYAAQQAENAVRSADVVGLGERLVNAVASYALYLQKAFWPWPGDLVPVYPLEKYGGLVLTPALLVTAIAVLAAITVAALLLRKHAPYVLTGWLWFLGMLVPVIGLVQVGIQARADRYMYLPLVGVALAVVWLIGDLVGNRAALKIVAASGGAIILAVLAWQSIGQQALYHDSITFWEYVVPAYPRNYLAHTNLGDAYHTAGRAAEAQREYERAVELNPDCNQAQFNLGCCYLAAGRYDEAIRCFSETTRVSEATPPYRPYVPAVYNIGWALLRQGHRPQAEAKFRQALAVDPDYVPARTSLIELLVNDNHLDEAVRQYRILVVVLQRAGRTAEAERCQAEAERLQQQIKH